MDATAHHPAGNPPATVAPEIGDTMSEEMMNRQERIAADEADRMWVGATRDEMQDAITNALASISRLEEENRNLHRELNQANAERDNAREILDRLNRELEEAKERLTVVSDELVVERNRHDSERARLLNVDIEADDPRVAELWRKAYRYANHAGFCSEFERIAEALGIPAMEIDWHGTAVVDVTVSVNVPVSGTAPRTDISNGDLDEYAAAMIDGDDIAEALNDGNSFSRWLIGEWSVQSVEDVEEV